MHGMVGPMAEHEPTSPESGRAGGAGADRRVVDARKAAGVGQGVKPPIAQLRALAEDGMGPVAIDRALGLYAGCARRWCDRLRIPLRGLRHRHRCHAAPVAWLRTPGRSA